MTQRVGRDTLLEKAGLFSGGTSHASAAEDRDARHKLTVLSRNKRKNLKSKLSKQIQIILKDN
jgi:hypothetical protein